MAITAAENIGATLVAYRRAGNLSQREMAQMLTDAGFKVDAARVSRIEIGRSNLRATELLQLCYTLSTTPNNILGVTPGVAQAAIAFAAILRNTLEDMAALERKINQ